MFWFEPLDGSQCLSLRCGCIPVLIHILGSHFVDISLGCMA